MKLAYENAQGDVTMAKSIADKMVAQKVDLIFCITTPSCQPAVRATASIPIVFGYVGDPVNDGLVSNYDRPGRNVSGVLPVNPGADQIKLIREVLPTAKNVGTVWNLNDANSRAEVVADRPVFQQLGLNLVEVNVSNANEVVAATQSLVGKVDALYVVGDSAAQPAMLAIIRAAQENRLPLFVEDVGSVQNGALATYSATERDLGKQAGDFIADVLGGQKIGDRAVQKPLKYSLVLNQTAAGRIGLTFPESVLRRADLVIK